jgi:uncharacterized protein YbbK (DUF523 family)
VSIKQVLVSACLLGRLVRYDGDHKRSASTTLARWIAEGRVIALCPEVMGGLPTPRPPAEIEGGADGSQVLAGRVRVIDATQADVSGAFLAGANLALEAAKRTNVRVAVLKEGSPSCGASQIHDGTFSGIRVQARGVTAALLEEHGIRIFNENEIDHADAYLMALETRG